MKKIPFTKPLFFGQELNVLSQVLESGRLQGNQVYTKKVNQFLQEVFHVPQALMTSSCSTALQMSALLLGLQQGDEVIMPSYTFVSTANAVVLAGAKPVFAEIETDTLTLDTQKIESKITKRTKAIFPVHYAGVSCDMDPILALADRYRLKVVEDAAQGVNAMYKDRFLGSMGHLGCYSFHETKNYVSGEGGAILVNDEELQQRAEVILEKGTNRSQFLRGEVDKYTWVDIGMNAMPSELQAALLWCQLERINEITSLKKQVYQRYFSAFRELERKEYIKLPRIPEYSVSNYHLFHFLVHNQRERDFILDRLKERGIQASFHYIPLHSSPLGKKLGNVDSDLPITEAVSRTIVRLPLYPGMSDAEVQYIIEAAIDAFDKLHAGKK